MKNTNNLFIWKDVSTWEAVLEEVFFHILTPSVINEIKQNKNKIIYQEDDNNFSFIEKFYPDFHINKNHVNSFINQYSHMRVYHACRPLDVSTYYDEGLLALNTKESGNIFKLKYLNNNKFPELTEEDIEQVISSTEKTRRDGVIEFSLDDRFIIRYANHYLKYGSEYLQTLEVELQKIKKHDYKSTLATIGTPTIFEVNLPVEFIESSVLGELLLSLLEQWVYNIAHSNNTTMVKDFAVTIRHNVPAKYIVNHYHPQI